MLLAGSTRYLMYMLGSMTSWNTETVVPLNAVVLDALTGLNLVGMGILFGNAPSYTNRVPVVTTTHSVSVHQ